MLHEFLEEVLDMRIHERSLEAGQEADVLKAKHEAAAILKEVDDGDVKTILLNYEDVKVTQNGLMEKHMYRAGLKDAVIILRLVVIWVVLQDL